MTSEPRHDGRPRDGPPRNGPPRDGPLRDGRPGEGPLRNGRPGEGPLRDGRPGNGPRRLSVPRQVAVDAADDGCPLLVDGREVDSVRESWLVEDRWWTDKPLRRRYWEIVTTCGRNEVVFCDLQRGRWWRQR